ncbi:glycosyltransferase family 2 protein [Maricaulis sp.]|uniref:glycosyltransferase family 2 protein n=1 Tax=Maricaulis sp. TaxID=1486257 RepID=UPI003A8E1446
MTDTTQTSFSELANTAWQRSDRTVLSILVPFYGDDPTALAAALNPLIGVRRDIEILLLDDGCPDPGLNEAVSRTVRALSAPARLLTAAENIGRSAGRNLLARQARGRWLLYLDADMQPGDDGFLDAYLERIELDDFDAAFGGYETAEPEDRRYHLHAVLARTSDEKDAAARALIGPTAYCSSNLLVRASVMRGVPFDTGFTGWGFEDVDWAVRAARNHNLIHFDNPASHAGLQTSESLLQKFRDGAVNYARLLEKHPHLAVLPGARAARTLGIIPFQALFRGLWARLANSQGLPVRLRTAALKLWRASWAAEAI